MTRPRTSVAPLATLASRASVDGVATLASRASVGAVATLATLAAAALLVTIVPSCTGDVVVAPVDAAVTPGSSGSVEASTSSCSPTERTCVGAEMRGCSPDGSGFLATPLEVCASQALCEAGVSGGRCAPPACAAGEITCKGNDRMACREDRTGTTLLGACAGATPVCSAGTCVPCIEGAVDCLGAIPRTCIGATWQAGAACTGEIDDTCYAGTCLDVRIPRWEMPNGATSTIRPTKYTILSANLVRDDVTKLEWQRGYSAAPIPTASGQRRSYCLDLELDGRRGFHIPSAVELMTLMDYTQVGSKIDGTIFAPLPVGTDPPGFLGGENTGASPRVVYETGLIETETITGSSFHVRCVRATEPPPLAPRYVVVGDEVTDTWTKLVWRKTDASLRTQPSALTTCVAPQRLPSAKELYSIVDPSQPSAAYYDHTIWNPARDAIWTSTDKPGDTAKLVVNFASPFGQLQTFFDANVRCVK